MGDLHLTPDELDWLRQFINTRLDPGFHNQGAIDGSLERFNQLTEKVKQLSELIGGNVSISKPEPTEQDAICTLTIVKKSEDNGYGDECGPFFDFDSDESALWAMIFALSENITWETYMRSKQFHIVFMFSVTINHGSYD